MSEIIHQPFDQSTDDQLKQVCRRDINYAKSLPLIRKGTEHNTRTHDLPTPARHWQYIRQSIGSNWLRP